MKSSFKITFILAIVSGLILVYIDSSSNWDDTGVEVFLLLIVSGILGFAAKQKPWLIALCISIWIPLHGIVFNNNFAGMIALLPAFIGAYAGYLIGKK